VGQKGKAGRGRAYDKSVPKREHIKGVRYQPARIKNLPRTGVTEGRAEEKSRNSDKQDILEEKKGNPIRYQCREKPLKKKMTKTSESRETMRQQIKNSFGGRRGSPKPKSKNTYRGTKSGPAGVCREERLPSEWRHGPTIDHGKKRGGGQRSPESRVRSTHGKN